METEVSIWSPELACAHLRRMASAPFSLSISRVRSVAAMLLMAMTAYRCASREPWLTTASSVSIDARIGTWFRSHADFFFGTTPSACIQTHASVQRLVCVCCVSARECAWCMRGAAHVVLPPTLAVAPPHACA
jgi:hypothetical protein